MSLEAKNLTAGYDNKPLIRDILLKVEPGKIVTLIGPNGAGKSTILKTCAGMLNPICGEVIFDDKNIYETDKSIRAQNISVMLTKREVPQYMTAFDVVAVGRYQYTNMFGHLTEKDRSLIAQMLKTVGAESFADKDFDKLSDGQKQRVFLARALVAQPKVLILDEPTGFLDIGYKLEFLNLLDKLAREDKMAILMSLHEIELAGLISDTIVCVNENNEIDRIDVPANIMEKSYISKLFSIKQSDISSKYWDESYKSVEAGYSENGETNEVNTSQLDEYKINLNEEFGRGQLAANRTTKSIKAHTIMVQGTMSNAGKSIITAGLCRIFKQDGYKVAPFKSQNMALNSYVTEDGLEMGRAQVVQAEAAGVKPSVYMNPILLKPTDNVGSQVIVNGKSIGNMKARDYFEFKKSLVPHIEFALGELSKENDIIVIEGAGSPAEINLKNNDIVNMGMAKIADAPVILVGDIDRGGVFAQLHGTVSLLDGDEKSRIKGLVINKFRGDKTILDPGIKQLEDKCRIPVVGVIPYMDVNIEDEDSLAQRLTDKKEGIIRIDVIRLPHISNFTDFMIFDEIDGVSVNYVSKTEEFGNPDMVIIPGTKSTIADMKWLYESGLQILIQRFAKRGGLVFGICGGYQMLGMEISDPDAVENGGSVAGLGLLNVNTILEKEKHLSQSRGYFTNAGGVLEILNGIEFEGYEIHMGRTFSGEETVAEFTSGGSGYCAGNIYGTYIHGVFDNAIVAKQLVKALADKKDINIDTDNVMDLKSYKESQYDKLADILREYLDMDSIYAMMGVDR